MEGESESAPNIPLAPWNKKEMLEADLGNRVKFPLAVSRHLRLRGMASSAKPELFNFKFTRSTVVADPETCNRMTNMPSMWCY